MLKYIIRKIRAHEIYNPFSANDVIRPGDTAPETKNPTKQC